jgi:hypothetical protein
MTGEMAPTQLRGTQSNGGHPAGPAVHRGAESTRGDLQQVGHAGSQQRLERQDSHSGKLREHRDQTVWSTHETQQNPAKEEGTQAGRVAFLEKEECRGWPQRTVPLANFLTCGHAQPEGSWSRLETFHLKPACVPILPSPKLQRVQREARCPTRPSP